MSIPHSVVESMYRAVRCRCSDLAFVHSRIVIASVPQTSLEISLLYLVFVFRCCFDALVAGSSCRSVNKKGSFVNSYVDTTLCVWIWTRQTIFLKRQIHYIFALLAGVIVLGTSARRQHNLIPSKYFAVARSKGWKNNLN